MISRDLEYKLDCMDQKIGLKELSECSGVSEATIRRVLNREVETNFFNLYRIAICLFGDDSILLDWCFHLQLPGNMKPAMEFLLLKNRQDLLESFIEKKVNQSGNKSAKKWAKIYKIVIESERGLIKNRVALKKLREVGGSDLETEILLKLIEANVFFKTVSTNAAYLYEMNRIVEEVESVISEVKDEFLLKSFNLRLNDLKGKGTLYVKSDVEKARIFANKNLSQNICQLFKANASYLIGVSFLFESYEESRRYIIEAISLYRESGHSKYASDLETGALPLIDSYYGVEHVGECDLSERAHFEAKWGDKKKAVQIIERIIKTEGESMYKLYCKGMALENDEILFKSLTQFLQIGDNFYAQLPLQQLKTSKDLKVRIMAEIMYKQFTE